MKNARLIFWVRGVLCMSKKLIASVVLGSVLFSLPALADEISLGYDKCMASAKSAEAKLDCAAYAGDYLLEKMEKNFASMKDRCKLLPSSDAKACEVAADKAQNAYIDYYDKMAVVLTYLATTQGHDDAARVGLNQTLNEITKFQGEILEAGIDLTYAPDSDEDDDD